MCMVCMHVNVEKLIMQPQLCWLAAHHSQLTGMPKSRLKGHTRAPALPDRDWPDTSSKSELRQGTGMGRDKGKVGCHGCYGGAGEQVQ